MPEVAQVQDGQVVFRAGPTRRFDAIILATGYRPNYFEISGERIAAEIGASVASREARTNWWPTRLRHTRREGGPATDPKHVPKDGPTLAAGTGKRPCSNGDIDGAKGLVLRGAGHCPCFLDDARACDGASATKFGCGGDIADTNEFRRFHEHRYERDTALTRRTPAVSTFDAALRSARHDDQRESRPNGDRYLCQAR